MKHTVYGIQGKFEGADHYNGGTYCNSYASALSLKEEWEKEGVVDVLIEENHETCQERPSYCHYSNEELARDLIAVVKAVGMEDRLRELI